MTDSPHMIRAAALLPALRTPSGQHSKHEPHHLGRTRIMALLLTRWKNTDHCEGRRLTQAGSSGAFPRELELELKKKSGSLWAFRL